MKDVVNEALKLDPHHIMDTTERPEDNFWIYEWESLKGLDIKSVSVRLMNLIISTDITPLECTYLDSKGTAHKCCLFIEGNSPDELLEVARLLEKGIKNIGWMFGGYRLPKNHELIRMECFHGKLYRK